MKLVYDINNFMLLKKIWEKSPINKISKIKSTVKCPTKRKCIHTVILNYQKNKQEGNEWENEAIILSILD